MKARETTVSIAVVLSERTLFSKEAGILPGPSVSYAVVFVDNRIQESMLLDLNKEVMDELDVTGGVTSSLSSSTPRWCTGRMCAKLPPSWCPVAPSPSQVKFTEVPVGILFHYRLL